MMRMLVEISTLSNGETAGVVHEHQPYCYGDFLPGFLQSTILLPWHLVAAFDLCYCL